MAGEWGTVELGSLASDRDGAIAIGPFGSAMKADVYTANGVPVIRGTNISSSRELGGDWVFIPDSFADAMPRCIVRSGDLVFPHRGSIGEVALVPGDRERYFLSTSLMKISLDLHKADPRFVFYFFRSSEGRAEIMRFTSQVGTPGIGQPLTSLRQFKVPCPPLPVQSAIAHLLWSLDDKIELNRQMTEMLEDIARAIFRSWFVNFDPVRAKMEGREPGIAADIAALFPAGFTETDDGEIPDRWHFGPISEVADLNPDTWSQAEYPVQIEYVDLANTKWGEISDVQLLERARAPSRAQRILKSGDTIVGTVRPGNGAYALIGRDGLTGSTGFAVLRPKRQSNREFIYLATTQRSVISHLAHLADGAAYPAVRPQVVAGIEVAIPNDDVLLAFSKMTAPLLDRMELSRSQSRILAAIRDLLLPKLMSGEVHVEDAERLLNQSGV